MQADQPETQNQSPLQRETQNNNGNIDHLKVEDQQPQPQISQSSVSSYEPQKKALENENQQNKQPKSPKKRKGSHTRIKIPQLKSSISITQSPVRTAKTKRKLSSKISLSKIQAPQPEKQTRQSIRDFAIGKGQIKMTEQYIIYEFLETSVEFDLYRAVDLKNRTKVIIKIFNKPSQYKDEHKNELHNIVKSKFEQINLQESSCRKSSDLFLPRCIDSLENEDYVALVFTGFYGERLDKFIQRKGSVNLDEALAILKQIILSYSELRYNGVVITHLLPSNIVFQNGVFRIFNLSNTPRQYFENLTNNSHNNHNIPQHDEMFIAPELKDLSEPPTKISESYFSSTTMWSVAVIFYLMICSDQEYENRLIDLKRQLKQKSFNFTMKGNQEPPKYLLILLSEMLNQNTEERMAFGQLAKLEIFERQEFFSNIKTLPLVDVRVNTIQSCYLSQQTKNGKVLSVENINVFEQKSKPNPQKIELGLGTNQSSQSKPSLTFTLGHHHQHYINPKNFKHFEQSTYKNLVQYNLNVQKAQYILNNILLPIQKYGLVDFKRRSHLQMIYLIYNRCVTNIIQATLAAKVNDRRAENYSEQLKSLYSFAKEKLNQIARKLQKVDKSTYYISTDIFSSVLKNKEVKEKEKFLTRGKEGVSYSMEQQIYFTQDHYIDKIMPQMKGEPKVLEKVKKVMDSYDRINDVLYEQVRGKVDFNEYVEKVLLSNHH